MAASAALTAAIALTPLLSSVVIAQETTRTIATGTGIPLSVDAPDRYTVKQGDTLWDIAKVFLRDPWFWPEIWYLNQQIKNPHLIFPGDVLALTSVDGKPQVTIAERGPEGAAADVADTSSRDGSRSGQRLSPRIRVEPINQAIATIPYEAVAGFLSKPSFLTKDQARSGPYLVGIRDMHAMAGEDNEVYARGIADTSEGTRFNMVHVDDKLRDPETGKVLGYRGIYVGQGTVTAVGNPTKLKMGQTEREALRGDRLYPEDVAIPLDFQPRAPSTDVQGSIMAVSGVSIVGNYQTVAINRGTQHGLEPGHVLAILQKGEIVRDRYAKGADGSFTIGKKVKLPDERIGVLMVFKAYERMSYALIMEATHPVRVADPVRTP
ncbi:MAG: LysM peptidoglycan-binding domain-containing protein [Candidatus Obscuribacterales bacterium]|nr:LysM peptidoglycan-binding domain-containing protein [Steroidobacteraceae bacterium]